MPAEARTHAGSVTEDTGIAAPGHSDEIRLRCLKASSWSATPESPRAHPPSPWPAPIGPGRPSSAKYLSNAADRL